MAAVVSIERLLCGRVKIRQTKTSEIGREGGKEGKIAIINAIP